VHQLKTSPSNASISMQLSERALVGPSNAPRGCVTPTQQDPGAQRAHMSASSVGWAPPRGHRWRAPLIYARVLIRARRLPWCPNAAGRNRCTRCWLQTGGRAGTWKWSLRRGKERKEETKLPKRVKAETCHKAPISVACHKWTNECSASLLGRSLAPVKRLLHPVAPD